MQPSLCACPQCNSGLVQPVEIHPRPQGLCDVQRRCPDCDWSGSGLFSEQAVARFEAAMDAATTALQALLVGVERARLKADAEHFAHALAQGHVLPEDF